MFTLLVRYMPHGKFVHIEKQRDVRRFFSTFFALLVDIAGHHLRVANQELDYVSLAQAQVEACSVKGQLK